jgi:AraC-like DNA-binding protein
MEKTGPATVEGASTAIARRDAAPVVFTTDTLPPAQRLEAWNAAFGSLNAITTPEAAEEGIGTRSVNWPLGPGMMLSVTRVSPARFVRDAARARRDGLDHLVLRVLRRGTSQLEHPGFTARLGPGELLLFSAHESWISTWTEAEWVSLCIARSLQPQLAASLAAMPSGPLRGAGAGLLTDLLLALPGRLAISEPADMPVLAEATRTMVAACFATGAPPAEVAAIDLVRQRVRQEIGRNIGSARLTPERLAAAAGLSRSALYRLFEAEGGVARHIRDVRLSLVHAALRDPQHLGTSIGELAEACGFPEPSAFSRAFRQLYGVTPSEVRRAGLQGLALPPQRLVPPPRTEQAASDLAGHLYGDLVRWIAPPPLRDRSADALR